MFGRASHARSGALRSEHVRPLPAASDGGSKATAVRAKTAPIDMPTRTTAQRPLVDPSGFFSFSFSGIANFFDSLFGGKDDDYSGLFSTPPLGAFEISGGRICFPSCNSETESSITNNPPPTSSPSEPPSSSGPMAPADPQTPSSADTTPSAPSANQSATAAGGDGQGNGTVPASSAANMSDPGEQICPKTTPEQVQGTVSSVQAWTPGPGTPGMSTDANTAGFLNTLSGSYTLGASASFGWMYYTGTDGGQHSSFNESAGGGLREGMGAAASGGYFNGTWDQLSNSSVFYVGACVGIGGEFDYYSGPGGSWGCSLGASACIGGWPVYFGWYPAKPNPE